MTLFVLVAPGAMFLVIKSRTFGVNWSFYLDIYPNLTPHSAWGCDG